MEKPNYYAILPAEVRYDKDLSSTAKLLYAEITALSNAFGYCCASNNFFAELYGVSARQIREIISELKEKGFLEVETKGSKRKIFAKEEKNFRIGGRKSPPKEEENFRIGGKKLPPKEEENFPHNITSINNIYNNNIYSSEQSSKQAVLYITLNDKSEYAITQAYIDEMQELYPNANVLLELKKMRAWCINNPKRRKTKSGITKFINSWLSRVQDKPTVIQGQDTPSYLKYFTDEEE